MKKKDIIREQVGGLNPFFMGMMKRKKR